MTPEDREHAAALAVAIELGWADYGEAVVWGGELLAGEATVPDDLLEVVSVVHPHPLDVVAPLRRLSVGCDSLRAFRRVLLRALEVLRSRPEEWSRVTLALEQMAIKGEVPDALVGPCLAFDDQRLLAEQGIYGSVVDVRSDLESFLEREALPEGAD